MRVISLLNLTDYPHLLLPSSSNQYYYHCNLMQNKSGMFLDEPPHIKGAIRRLLKHPPLRDNTSNVFRGSYIKCWIPTGHVLRRTTALEHF